MPHPPTLPRQLQLTAFATLAATLVACAAPSESAGPRSRPDGVRRDLSPTDSTKTSICSAGPPGTYAYTASESEDSIKTSGWNGSLVVSNPISVSGGSCVDFYAGAPASDHMFVTELSQPSGATLDSIVLQAKGGDCEEDWSYCPVTYTDTNRLVFETWDIHPFTITFYHSSSVLSGAEIYTNMPSGMTVLLDSQQGPNDGLTLSTSSEPNAAVRHVTDNTIPLPGETTAVEFFYPTGFSGSGVSPGRATPTSGELLNGQTGYREVFLGYYAKRNPDWEVAPAGANKDVFFWGFNPDAGFSNETTIPWVTRDVQESMFFYNFQSPAYMGAPGPSGGVYAWGDANSTQFPNQPAKTTVSVSYGSWHKIELHMRFASSDTATDGIVRVWVDGNLMSEYTDVHYFRITRMYFDPTWGGAGGSPMNHDNYFRIAHTVFAVR